MPPEVLAQGDIDAFHRDGFVHLRDAFSRAQAAALVDEIWAELESDHGIARDDPRTWRQPPHSPRRAKHHPLASEVAGRRMQGAISDLIGHDDWRRPQTWGGFNVNFPGWPPGEERVPTETWHWDGMQGTRGLQVFSCFAQVPPGGGGTVVVSGSHRLIADYYASMTPAQLAQTHGAHRKRLYGWDPWLAALSGQVPCPEDRRTRFMERTTPVRDIPCRVVELTGEPGDAIFCHPYLLHATSPNGSNLPRFVRVKFLFLD